MNTFPTFEIDNSSIFSASGTRTRPVASLFSSGYVPGQSFPAQHENFFMYSLTTDDTKIQGITNSIFTELSNVLSISGTSVNPGSQTQLKDLIVSLGAPGTESWRFGTSAITNNGLVKWSSSGVLQSNSPSNSNDVANKSYTDSSISSSISSSGTSSIVNGGLVRWDANGRLFSNEPSVTSNVATKYYVDNTAGSIAPANLTLVRREDSGQIYCETPDVSNVKIAINYFWLNNHSDTAATANSWAVRDSSGYLHVNTPTTPFLTHILNYGWLTNNSTDSALANSWAKRDSSGYLQAVTPPSPTGNYLLNKSWLDNNSSSTAAANSWAKRDSSGYLQAVTPPSPTGNYLLNKSWLDANSSTGNVNNTWVKRDGTGIIKCSDPVLSGDTANKNYVDTTVEFLNSVYSLTTGNMNGSNLSINIPGLSRIGSFKMINITAINTGANANVTLYSPNIIGTTYDYVFYFSYGSSGVQSLAGTGSSIANGQLLATVPVGAGNTPVHITGWIYQRS